MIPKSIRNDLGDEGLETQFHSFPNYSMSIMQKQCSTSYVTTSPGSKTTHLLTEMSLGLPLGLLLAGEPENHHPSLVQTSQATMMGL